MRLAADGATSAAMTVMQIGKRMRVVRVTFFCS